MKKILAFLMGLFVLSGCGGSTYDVEIADVPTFIPDEAQKISFKITKGNKPQTGLEVEASFEMEKMDHGTIEISLKEQEEGVYAGEVALPMEGDWQALLLISNGSDTEEKLVTFTVNKGEASAAEFPEGVVATINGDEITTEDLEFYEFINHVQIAMYREADKAKYKGKELEEAMKYWDAQEKAAKNKSTLLTQIIRLRAMALLAEEKGHTASEGEVLAKLNETKNMYKTSPVAQQMIKEFGEEKFWAIQEKQHKAIVLVSKVQQDMIDNVKKANPKAESKEINMLAQKKYEELLVSQVSSLNIKINQL